MNHNMEIFSRKVAFQSKWPTHLLFFGQVFTRRGENFGWTPLIQRQNPEIHIQKNKKESRESVSINLRQGWLHLWSCQCSCYWCSVRSQVLLCLVLLLEQNNSVREGHLQMIVTHRFHTELFSVKIKRLKCCWKSIATTHKSGTNVLVLIVFLTCIFNNKILQRCFKSTGTLFLPSVWNER